MGHDMRFPGFAFLFVAAVLSAAPALADGHELDKFVGRYEGKAIETTGPKTETGRDLSVTIERDAETKGFTVEWTTVIWRPDRKEETQKFKVRFFASKRPHIYAAAMRKDMFGKFLPLDPMTGEPYFWARIQGRTLSIFYVLVTDEGGYEMQVYHRTLSADGKKMDVEFRRVIDGVAQRVVAAELTKVR
jgi:hypothetical protein